MKKGHVGDKPVGEVVICTGWREHYNQPNGTVTVVSSAIRLVTLMKIL